MTPSSADMAFRARALAQTHPLTPTAQRFAERTISRHCRTQPMAESAEWARAALISGYCLRRVEEVQLAVSSPPPGHPLSGNSPTEHSAPPEGDLARVVPKEPEPGDADAGLAEAVEKASAAIYAGELVPGPDAQYRTVEALDTLIAREVERRFEAARDIADEQLLAELEEYLTWWTVTGYALRMAEEPGDIL